MKIVGYQTGRHDVSSYLGPTYSKEEVLNALKIKKNN